MAEWFKAPVLKTGVGQLTVGSNPSLSAEKTAVYKTQQFFLSEIQFFSWKSNSYSSLLITGIFFVMIPIISPMIQIAREISGSDIQRL